VGQDAEMPSAQEVIKRHSSAVQLVYSFDMEIDLHYYISRTDEPPGPLMARWRWSKRRADDLERIRWRYLKSGRSGDIFRDGKVERSIRDWDPEKPNELRGVFAATAPQTPQRQWGWVADPSHILLFSILHEGTARTPEELLRWSPAVKVLGGDAVGGHDVWKVRFAIPDSSGNPSESYIDLYFDPSVNYLVRKSVVRVKTNEKDYAAPRQVTKFKDCGKGVFFPLEVEIGGANNHVATHRVRELVVNSELPSDALDFSFPPKVMVRHLPPGMDGRVELSIRDSDGAPMRKMTPEEVKRLTEKRLGPRPDEH
jgi:hypothetical protein